MNRPRRAPPPGAPRRPRERRPGRRGHPADPRTHRRDNRHYRAPHIRDGARSRDRARDDDSGGAAGGSDLVGGFTPAEILVGGRHLCADDAHIAVLVVVGYPRDVGPAWLDPLLTYPGRIDVSLHVDPIDPLTAAERLRRRLARLEAGRRHGAEHARLPDPDTDAAAEDAHDLAARLARGETRLFRVGLYLAVHADTDTALAEQVAAVRALAASLLLDARPASWRQLAGWTSCLPLGLDRLDVDRIMDTDAVAAGFPFSSPDLPPPDPASPRTSTGVLYGYNAASSGLVHWDRFAQDNYNAVVLARSGAGKSYLVKLELLRSLYRGIEGFVLDPEGEYVRLTHAVGGVVLDLGAPGVHLNPLDLPLYRDRDGRLRAPADAYTQACLFTHTTLAVLLGEPDPPRTRRSWTPRSPPPTAAPGSPPTRRPGAGPRRCWPTSPTPSAHPRPHHHGRLPDRAASAPMAGSGAGGSRAGWGWSWPGGCTRSPTAPTAGCCPGRPRPPRPGTW